MISPTQLREMSDHKKARCMERQAILGTIEWRLLLTPISSMRRVWVFDVFASITYYEIYIFGIRVVRWRV